MTMHNVANFGSFLHYVSLFIGDPYAPRRHAKQRFRHGWASLGAHKTTYAGLCRIVASCSLFCTLLDNKKG